MKVSDNYICVSHNQHLYVSSNNSDTKKYDFFITLKFCEIKYSQLLLNERYMSKEVNVNFWQWKELSR